jgi:hypothetical protein
MVELGGSVYTDDQSLNIVLMCIKIDSHCKDNKKYGIKKIPTYKDGDFYNSFSCFTSVT